MVAFFSNYDEIVEHMSTPLVLWGSNPGDDRTPIPMPETVEPQQAAAAQSGVFP